MALAPAHHHGMAEHRRKSVSSTDLDELDNHLILFDL